MPSSTREEVLRYIATVSGMQPAAAGCAHPGLPDAA